MSSKPVAHLLIDPENIPSQAAGTPIQYQHTTRLLANTLAHARKYPTYFITILLDATTTLATSYPFLHSTLNVLIHSTGKVVEEFLGKPIKVELRRLSMDREGSEVPSVGRPCILMQLADALEDLISNNNLQRNRAQEYKIFRHSEQDPILVFKVLLAVTFIQELQYALIFSVFPSLIPTLGHRMYMHTPVAPNVGPGVTGGPLYLWETRALHGTLLLAVDPDHWLEMDHAVGLFYEHVTYDYESVIKSGSGKEKEICFVARNEYLTHVVLALESQCSQLPYLPPPADANIVPKTSHKGEGHTAYVSLRTSNIPRMVVNASGGHNVIGQLASQGLSPGSHRAQRSTAVIENSSNTQGQGDGKKTITVGGKTYLLAPMGNGSHRRGSTHGSR